MKEDWREYTIDNVAKIINGYAFKSKDFISSGIPIVKIKSLKDKMLVIDKGDFVDEEFLKLNEKYHIKYDDFVIAMTGSHITLPSSAVGRVAKSRHKEKLLLNQRVGKFKVKDKICDHNFLYYFLTTDHFFQNLGLRAKGAGNQANISNGDIGSIKIHLPPLPTQQKIANILSAYDDLIENNIKRIELLEEQAQLIYEEWFVRMKFPHHENTKTDAETGLPKGWKDTKIGEVFKTSSGGTPSKKKETEYYENGHIPWVRTGELKQFILIESELYITEKGLKESSAKMFPKNTVLLAMYGNTIGETTFAAKSVSTNQACCAFLVEDDKEYLSYFIHQYLLYNKEYILNFRMGAAQENISQSIIKNIEIRIPSTDIFLKFEELIKPLYLLIENLAKQNKYLKEARDILLPRLMMGIIEV